jgi:hypothetical protein
LIGRAADDATGDTTTGRPDEGEEMRGNNEEREVVPAFSTQIYFRIGIIFFFSFSAHTLSSSTRALLSPI